MDNYQVKRIDDFTYRIDDTLADSMYLIIGSKHALLIDCGMGAPGLRDLIRTITSKDVVLALSHGHLDHVGRSAEFDKVYMSMEDRIVYQENLDKPADGLAYKPLEGIQDLDFDSFDLGDQSLKIVPLAGHTPGSVIFVDTKHHHVFTGDAIGSGCGVWMQCDHSLGLDEYRDNLQNAYDYLKFLGVDSSWLFLGGHANQEYQSKVSSFNRLDIDLLHDMIELCDHLLAYECEYELSDATAFHDQPYYAACKKAEMIFTLPQIECAKIDLNYATKAFDRYLANYNVNNSRIRLKMVHTFGVMDISEYLSIHAHMNPLDTRLAILIAMLHDIGRFEQLKRFDSFDDSIIDHAKIGIDVLFKQKKIRNFIKTDEYDQIIYDAIEQHSLYAIDESLEGKSLLHARLIRDSDKLDNYRVKNTESIKTLFGIDQAEFEIETVSPNILEDIMNHRLIVKDDRTTHLDMYVSYLAFAFDLNFKASYQWLKESDYIEKNIDRFTYYHAYKEMYQIKKELLAYIDEKISEDL